MSNNNTRYIEAVNKIKSFEQDYDVLRHQLDGWSVWPIVRGIFFYKIAGVSVPVRKKLTLIQLAKSGLHDLLKIVSVRNRKFVIFSFGHALQEGEKGKFKNAQFDDLLLKLGNFLKIERISNAIFYHRLHQALLRSELSDSLPFVLSRIMAKIYIPPKVRHCVAQLMRNLTTIIGCDQAITVQISREISIYYWEKALYKLLFRFLGARFVLLGNPLMCSIVAAAKECDMKVVEFQHGFLDAKTHFGYAWRQADRQYKSFMHVPDVIFTYGQHWTDELLSTGFWETEPMTVGSLRIDSFRARSKKEKGPGPVVIWTSDGVNVEPAIQFMAEALKQVPANYRIRMIIKLHPAYEASKELYLSALSHDPRVQVLLGSESPSTFEILVESNLHLSGHSTCHYDAIALEVPTMVLPFDGHEKVAHLINNGLASLISSPAELAVRLMDTLSWKSPNRAGDHYFKPGALSNMLHALRSLEETEVAKEVNAP